MILKEITYLQYLDLPEEDKGAYDFAIQYGKFEPKDVFEFGDFFELPFGKIKDWQYTYSSGMTLKDLVNIIIEYKKEYTDKDISKVIGLTPINDICHFLAYFRQQMDLINTGEKVKLSNVRHDSKQIAAGIEDFSELGNFLQFNELTNNDITKYDAVYNTKYSLCFLQLVYNTTMANYQKNLLKNAKV